MATEAKAMARKSTIAEPSPASVAPGAEHYNVLRLPAHYIDMVLRYEYGQRLANVRYELEVAGITIKGKTDENGRFQARVPAKEVDGNLTIWLVEDDPDARLKWPIRINALPPISEISGVQARLNNLGLYGGPISGEMNADTKAAIIELQELLEFEKPTGELDRETRDMIEALNNSL